MNWESITVSISLLLGLGILISDKVSAEVVFFVQLIFFWNLNIIDTEEALSGFSNRGLVAIGALYIIVHPLSNNEYLNKLFRWILKDKNLRLSLLKVCSLIAVLSAFLNNTPLVQLITPIIRKYSRLNHFPTSRFLMPISFSSIIGGTFTLIGTSTNLIIVSLLPDTNIIGFFDTAILAFPFFLIYLVYNYFFNEKLLPIRSGLFRGIKNNFFVNIKPKHDIKINKFTEDLGINPSEILGIYNKENNSINYNELNLETISNNVYICIKTNSEQINNIINSEKYEILDCPIESIQKDKKVFYECAVGNITEMDKSSFEHKYNCKIIASRNNKNTIHKGSTILIITSNDFYSLWRNSNDFYMISLFNKEESNKRKLPVFLFFIMIGVTGAGLYPIEKSSTTLVVIYFIFRIIDIKDALKMINYGLLLVIGSSFGISQAMQNSGISQGIADLVSNMGSNWWTIFIITQLIAQILTEVVTNNAVAALMTQIIVDICNKNGFDLKPFIIGLMISCSCSFITPYGYATNLIIQGTGGYKFKDYFKYGIAVKIIGFLISFGSYFWILM